MISTDMIELWREPHLIPIEDLGILGIAIIPVGGLAVLRHGVLRDHKDSQEEMFGICTPG